MSYINANSFRNRLHNKRSEPYGFGKNPNTGMFDYARTADKLYIRRDNGDYAILTESIYNNDLSNFKSISYGPDIDNLIPLSASSYTVLLDQSVIQFNQDVIVNGLEYYAFYEGEGSIIWVEDVTSLQDVVRSIDSGVVYKDSAEVNSNLNMRSFSIVNVSTVDSIKLINHSHTGLNNDAPQITVEGLANNAVQTPKIKDAAVTSSKIKEYDVLAINLGTYAVTTPKIADLNVTTQKIADANIVNSKIANNTIEYSKFNVSNVLRGIFNALYPVGAIYITADTTDVCPIQQYVGSWAKVSSGKVLQGSTAQYPAGSEIQAGLPNIKGMFHAQQSLSSTYHEGAFDQYGGEYVDSGTSSHAEWKNVYTFNAADGEVHNDEYENLVYGKSDTVQPPAYSVNIFQRIS